MNWKKWKIGLGIALAIGFFTACGAAAILDVRINLKFLFFFLGLVGKDVVLYLKEHPAEAIEESGPDKPADEFTQQHSREEILALRAATRHLKSLPPPYDAFAVNPDPDPTKTKP